MKLKVPYGQDGDLEIEVPDENLAGIFEPNDVRPDTDDPLEALSRSLDSPVGGETFDRFLAKAENLTVLVNDATRPTPTALVLDLIADRLAEKDPTFMVATGIHRPPTREEYLQIFGKSHYERFKDNITAHDARNDEDMVFLGHSRQGTPMKINKAGARADSILIISSVEPHYFAGYTGGRKSFLPGIASYETIEKNHRLALKPEARALALGGNPVHEDMVDALACVENNVFAINTVLDKNHRLYAVESGDIHESLRTAAARADEVFGVKVREKADIVVSVVGFPADIDLYQSQKGIDNAKLALKQGGIMILVSRCRQGIGEETFAKLLSEAGSPKAALETIARGYKLGYHKAAKMAEIFLWAQVWAVTELEPASLESLYMKPFSDLQKAVDAALAEKGSNAKVLFLMDSSLTVPLVEEP